MMATSGILMAQLATPKKSSAASLIFAQKPSSQKPTKNHFNQSRQVTGNNKNMNKPIKVNTQSQCNDAPKGMFSVTW